MNDLNVVNDTQGTVVESQTESAANTGGAEDIGTKSEPAARRQTHSQNSGFKRMRLENEQFRKEIESLRGTISELEKLKDIQKTSDIYLEKLINDKMERDLKEIQRADPSVESLYDLGDDFLRLVENGIEPTKAYFALKEAADFKKSKKPPALKPMNTASFDVNPFYSSKELDRLTPRDLENPKIFKKAMESLKKL